MLCVTDSSLGATESCMLSFVSSLCIRKLILTSPRVSPMTGRYSLRARTQQGKRRAPSSCSSSSSVDAGSYAAESPRDKSDDDFLVQSGNVESEDSDNSAEELDPSYSSEKHSSPRVSTKRRRRPVNALNTKDISVVSIGGDSALSEFTPDEVSAFRKSILTWYVANCRQLPWRAQPRFRVDAPCLPLYGPPASESSPGAPYAVWVSEIMSQQTRLSVCVEYWKRWMQAFPTVEALANAPLERVNELWAGLGYYRRAKFLHEGAKQVFQENHGNIPNSIEGLLKVKGIGKYTAGAICSVAFNIPVPAVDGNVERVLSRVRPGIMPNLEPTNSPVAKAKVFDSLAASLVKDIECAGDFNQALMELGALVCTPKSPQCGSCPVREVCGAYSDSRKLDIDPAAYAERYPVKDLSKKTKVRDEVVLTCIVCRKRNDEDMKKSSMEYLLVQRPKQGLLAGMWECPNVILSADEANNKSKELLAAGLTTHLRSSFAHAKIKANFEKPRVTLGETKHVFSHIRQRLQVDFLYITGTPIGGVDNDPEQYRWLTESEIADSAVATQMRKVLKLGFRHSKCFLK